MIFYPSCRWLDPNNRSAAGHFFCEFRCRHVKPAASVYLSQRRGIFAHAFCPERCAPDCRNRSGKTRRATF